jgi:hypothetical protein
VYEMNATKEMTPAATHAGPELLLIEALAERLSEKVTDKLIHQGVQMGEAMHGTRPNRVRAEDSELARYIAKYFAADAKTQTIVTGLRVAGYKASLARVDKLLGRTGTAIYANPLVTAVKAAYANSQALEGITDTQLEQYIGKAKTARGAVAKVAKALKAQAPA